MNRYQKKLNRETRELIELTHIPFLIGRKILKFRIKTQWCRPCRDCDNADCENIKNVLAYCSYRR